MANQKCPRNPGRVLTTSFKMGIAITLALAKDRATGLAKILYFGQGARIIGMAEIWRRAKEAYLSTVKNSIPDVSVLLKIEHAIRRSFTRILLMTSVRYGNSETKRVKKEEGKKGYLNILWDYSGSRIRDIVKARYIFSTPSIIERSDGSKVYGYPGTTKIPFYPVRHNHLPELDFGDMIRSPLMELARQCLKYGVPIKDAKIFIDTLLFKYIPFMDYVYTERRSGKSNYVREALKELRVIIDQIKIEYGTRNGERQSITTEVQENLSFEEILADESILIETNLENVDSAQISLEKKRDFIPSAIGNAIEQGAIQEELLPVVTRFLKSVTLTNEDSTELLKQAQEQSRRIGIQFHNYIAKNFQSPFSFNGLLFHGKEMAYDASGLMLFSEVSIDNGRGRIDLILVQAKELSRVDESFAPIYCEPLLIADLKTKSAFDFDIYGIESQSTTSSNIVNEFVLERRSLTEDEWATVISNIPDDSVRGQLDAYETAVIDAYRNMRRDDADAPDGLTKAVIVVDSFQNWKTVSEAILPLMLKTYQGCIDGSLSEGNLIIPSDDNASIKIALKLISVSQSNTAPVPLNPPAPMEPFKVRVKDDKDLILYLTVAGRGSPSQSAAAIAERWHGLEYLYGLAKGKHRDVIWLDLVGEYNDSILKKKQFRLAFQTASIKRFFNHRVQMKDFSEQIRSRLLEGTPLNFVRAQIQALLKDSRNPIVVVSGWENLRRTIVPSKNEYLDEIATTIIQALPRKCTTIWFTRPVPLAQNNITYATRCVAPFYQGSIWQNFVDTIIWNVALPPNRPSAYYPTNDHERAIFIETPGKNIDRKLIEVAPLRDWGKDFRSGGHRERTMYQMASGQSLIQSYSNVNNQLEKALELIPHLASDSDYNPRPRSDDTIIFTKGSSTEYPKQDLHTMLSFRPTQIHAFQHDEERSSNENAPTIEIDGRVKILLPMSSINRKREYREMKLHASLIKRTTKPPNEYYLRAHKTDDLQIALTEMRQLRNTIRFLKVHGVDHLASLLERISDIISTDMSRESATPLNVLRLVRQTLETHPLSEDIWNRLSPYRPVSPQELTISQSKYLESLQSRHPDIVFITGNHLFLLLLAILGPPTATLYTDSLRSLWNYLRPWYLISLGFRVEYPKGHIKRRSVFDRDKIFKQLKKRNNKLNRQLNQQRTLRQVRLGQLIVCSQSETDGSLYLWLLFQRSPGNFDMNAALLNLRGIDSTLNPVEILQDVLSERTYWSESDLSRLSWYANLQGSEWRIPIMLAVQRGVQTLFLQDSKARIWKPIARVDYRTRKFEDVTLIRTISLTKDPYVQPVSFEDIRHPIHHVTDMIERALFILNKGLEGCTHARCKVTLDNIEKMYRVSFFDYTSGNALGNLLINRTVDLLEILRRPDNACEPVIIRGRQLIWNRFKDIILDEDVALTHPWVNRHHPFPSLSLDLPSTANDLLEAHKESDLIIELYHDPWTCSLRHISLEAILQGQQHAHVIGPHFISRYISEWAEPECISNEPGIHHSSCWRIHIRSKHPLPEEIEELKEVRFTDAQLRALLRPQELAYWSIERKEWRTHTFSIMFSDACMKEIQESWHLQMLLKEMTGTEIKPNVPGTYLQNPDIWRPIIDIQPECIILELRGIDSKLVREHRILEKNVALRDAAEVKELLNNEMSKFLKSCGIEANRRMATALQNEIADAIEISGVVEDKARVELDSVIIGQDSVGGRVIYAILTSNDEIYRIPITGHLHNLKEVGRIAKEDFVYEVESILGEFNLSEESLTLAVEECLRLMRKEGFIKR